MLHVANTVLLFVLFRRMTGATGRSAFVAAIFAVHPLHVESVAWIAERKDVLSTFFWMLTLLAYVALRRGGRRWTRYARCGRLFALALMSKPMVVTLPVVLLLLDVWPLRRALPAATGRRWRAVLEKVPLLALALATSVATVIVQHRVGAMAGLDALPWHDARRPTRRSATSRTCGRRSGRRTWRAFYPLFTISAPRGRSAPRCCSIGV